METKMNLLTTILFFTATTTAVIPYSYAQDDVHFGSIFAEDKNHNNGTTKDFLNTLTDKSGQQRNLENLHGDLKQKNKRLRGIVDKPKPQKKKAIAVVKNSELTRKVTYFMELRPIPGNSSRPLYGSSNTSSRPLAQLEPGEMVKVVDLSKDYIHKMRMDRDNQGVWKQVARKHTNDPLNLYTYYDWKNFETISPSETAIELDILVPRNMSSVPVYSRPGPWTPKDCNIKDGLCLERIDQHSEVFLFDTTFASINDLRTRKSKLQLFYKVGYRHYDKEGLARHKIGWIPSFMARRKINQIPKSLLGKRGFTGFETDEERIERLSKYYVFKDNMYSDNRLTSRWLKSRPGEQKEVFEQTTAYDGVVGFQYFKLNQSFEEDEFSQYGIFAGLGIYLPLFVDLEVQGTFLLTVPVKYAPEENPNFDSAFLFRADQWLMYTTPLGFNKLPIKLGLGGYYITMFQSDSQFGFKSFMGIQIKAALESDKYWFDVRYGPTGRDFNFRFSNREVGTSMGFRLNPEEAYDSWTIFLDYSSSTFVSPETKHTTEYEIFNLGLRKTF